MKSSNEWPHRAIEYAKLRILKFAESPLEDANFFNGYMELVSSDSGHSDLDDALHTLLEKAKKDKLHFITLKRICAHYETRGIEKPRELSVWLFNMLRDIEVEPKSGKTGPNKSQTEHLFLLGMTATIAETYQKPIYQAFLLEIVEAFFRLLRLRAKKRRKNWEG